MKIVVGQGSCGIAAGANKVSEALNSELSQRNSSNHIETTGCCGTCYLEPIVDVYDDLGNKTTFVQVQAHWAKDIIDFALLGKEPENAVKMTEEDHEAQRKQKKVALRNAGTINPENIHDYLKRDGYEAIKKCLTEMTPLQVIEEIKISGLRGRGGAGFPTWFKWNAAYQQKDKPKYIVCNGDEGDPGAFMDRSILEGDPHSVIEGMMIGGYAIDAN